MNWPEMRKNGRVILNLSTVEDARAWGFQQTIHRSIHNRDGQIRVAIPNVRHTPPV